MEHRWGERVQVDFPVRVTAHRFSVRDGRLTDLSVSGARVEAELEARALARVRVAIDLPLWPKHESPVIEAYVARKYEHGSAPNLKRLEARGVTDRVCSPAPRRARSGSEIASSAAPRARNLRRGRERRPRSNAYGPIA
jgi:hypothetical protein